MNNKVACFSCGIKLDYKIYGNDINPQCRTCLTQYYDYLENSKTYR